MCTLHFPFEPQRLLLDRRHNAVYRLFGACGAYRLVAVIGRLRSNDSLGVAYFAHSATEDFPFWQTCPAEKSSESASESVCADALALGPMYREADGSWLALAGLPAPWFDARLEVTRDRGEFLDWSVDWKVYGGPMIRETFQLAAGGLTYSCFLQWTIPGFRIQVPVFLTDGHRVGTAQILGPTLRLGTSAWLLQVECHEPEDAQWTLEPAPAGATLAQYARAIVQSRFAVRYQLHVQALAR